MSKFLRLTAAAAVIVTVLVVPSGAFARLNLNPIAAAPGSGPIQSAVVTPAQRPPAAISSSSFQWGDAALGAAGMLVLIGVGWMTVAAARRRGAHPVIG